MYPPGHLAFGYICYSLYFHIRWKRPPPGDETLILLLGTQFPDLVDKPLALLGVFPYSRYVGHSLITIALLVVFLWFVTKTAPSRRRLVAPFTVGAISHSIADIIPKLLYGHPLGADFGWLLWPVIVGTPSYRPPEDIADYYSFPGSTLLEEMLDLTIILFSGSAVVLWIVAGSIVWWYDGKPGLRELTGSLKRD